jgi:hypothetical protein
MVKSGNQDFWWHGLPARALEQAGSLFYHFLADGGITEFAGQKPLALQETGVTHVATARLWRLSRPAPSHW